MTTTELLRELQSLGVKLEIKGDRLTYHAPLGVFTSAHCQALKEHKLEILQLAVVCQCSTWCDGPAGATPGQFPVCAACGLIRRCPVCGGCRQCHLPNPLQSHSIAWESCY